MFVVGDGWTEQGERGIQVVKKRTRAKVQSASQLEQFKVWSHEVMQHSGTSSSSLLKGHLLGPISTADT